MYYAYILFKIWVLCLLFSVTAIHAQDIPSVYNVENTGADYPASPLPDLRSLPIDLDHFYDFTDDGCRLIINDQTIIEEWTSEEPIEYTGTMNLAAGQRYPIVVEFYEEGGEAVAQLSWSSNSQEKQIIPQDRLYAGRAGTLGDVNEDGEIDIVDALLITQYYVDLNPANFTINNVDTNCDGEINIIDTLLGAQFYVGLINSFC
jgi:hypothetical protein